MRTEIGSEFWDVPTTEKNSLFPENIKWFISGRSALKAIIRDSKFKSVSLPDWCCESMVEPFLDEGIKVSFYPAFNRKICTNADAVLVIDYFGYTQNHQLCDFDGIIIRDITHSLLSSSHNDADYYFGSLRKWAGFATGGFAWGFKSPICYEGDFSEFIRLKKTAMADKKAYITEKTDKKNYFENFGTAEDMLEHIGVFPADEDEGILASKLDVDFIKEKRRKNASVLLDAFRDIAIFPELRDNDCPLFVPIKVKKRNELRSYLIQKEIYCPFHWPKASCHTDISPEAEEIYACELSLICDQRYDENDMRRIVSAVKEFLNKENS